MKILSQGITLFLGVLTFFACISIGSADSALFTMLAVKQVDVTTQAYIHWNTTENMAEYVLCYATVSIPANDIANCTSYPNGHWTEAFATGATEHTLSSLALGTTYYMRMANTNAEGERIAASEEVSVDMQRNKGSALNNAALSQCANDSSNITACQKSGSPKKDTKHKRADNVYSNFTKISSTGDVLANDASIWSCVKDNMTGLIWEGKTNDKGLHDKNDTYNWYEPDHSKNGGHVGYSKLGGDICFDYDAENEASFCNTHAYVKRVNREGFCGASNWRLPKSKELRSIVSRHRTHPSINTDWFVHTLSAWFWSSSPYNLNKTGARVVHFDYGLDSADYKKNGHPVRLVHTK